jgi:hypothetical protein
MFAVTDKYGNLYYQTSGVTFSNVNQMTGDLLMKSTLNNFALTNYYFIVADGNYISLTTAPAPPYYGGLKAYAMYDVCYGMAGFGGSDITVYIGTNRSFLIRYPQYVVDMGSDLVGINWHNQQGVWNHGFGTVDLTPGNSYEPGIQYYYQTYNLPILSPASIELSTGLQFVYTGWGKLPQ